MALKIDTTFRGIPVAGAYVRVIQPVIERDKVTLSFGISYHADATNPSFQVVHGECAYDMGGLNPLCQAYEYLKTLDEFSGAEDVLEEGRAV